ncbi:MAG TPA: hypothetical protein VND19_19860 [Acetobacteraceae bacterium]|nr:hypothetical protein [Acetobacteraceae bacterium]
MTTCPDLSELSRAEKDALILVLWQRLEAAEQRIAELGAKLAEPAKTPDNSSVPPSKGQKPNQPEKTKRVGPRKGSLAAKAVAGRWPAIRTKPSPPKSWPACIARLR